MWFINNRALFLIVLEVASPESGCQHGPMKVPFGAADFSLYPYMAEGVGELADSVLKGH